MSDPTSKHKPYTTGAEPSTTEAKANVHMSNSGWVRTITATDYAWAGNDDANSDPEVLVAFRGAHALQGFYTYTYWYTKTPSQATPVLIDVHVHFSENVTVTGTPQITISNTQGGVGGGGTAASLTASYTSGSGGHRLVFRTGVPSANQLKENDILFIGINALSGIMYEKMLSDPKITVSLKSDENSLRSSLRKKVSNFLTCVWFSY